MDTRGDFLVIGSGIAGLRAALSLADAGDVVVLTKADPRESNTGYAQGGIAAAIGPDDSPELHARDTIAAGDGLCMPRAVDVLVREGRAYVRELHRLGRGIRSRRRRPACARTRSGAQRPARAARARRDGARDRAAAVVAGQRARAHSRHR